MENERWYVINGYCPKSGLEQMGIEYVKRNNDCKFVKVVLPLNWIPIITDEYIIIVDDKEKHRVLAKRDSSSIEFIKG